MEESRYREGESKVEFVNELVESIVSLRFGALYGALEYCARRALCALFADVASSVWSFVRPECRLSIPLLKPWVGGWSG